MRNQLDAAITFVSSPESGFFVEGLRRSLMLWPRVRDLTLLNVSDPRVDTLQPLSMTSLAGLTSLTIRQMTGVRDFPTFSSSVAATLQVIDISGWRSPHSIDAVRSCVQLRYLRIPWVLGVWALEPLAACSQLKELWMVGHLRQTSLVGSAHVTSLAPLKA
ncbi:hypothetical protein FOA52_002440 [Chlamydomonas sp. UWO 241]|nr:hypothetical protein FOA52_002440 [Chlamydomonas sp. UWO 241]